MKENFATRKTKNAHYYNTAMARNRMLLDNASKINCEALVAFEPENVFYSTGFWGEAVSIVSEGRTKLIAPKLEVERAKKEAKGCEVISTERGSNMIETLLSNVNDSSVCTDCNDIATFEKMKKKIKKLVRSAEPFYQSRKIKDGKEIKIISDASKILDKLFAKCEVAIKVGVTEKEVQAKLLYEAMKMGAYPPSYKYTMSPLIIASGINSSLPHAEPSRRRIGKGEFVTVDLTLRYKGYIADATRTFAVGRISTQMRKVYDIVREAHDAGLDAVNDGAGCGDVDKSCRSLIEKRGYGKYFIHSTGHGIGLQVHEPPWLRMKSKEILEKNMTVTVEPGIYVPDKFGVRIEDSLLVDRKAKSLNKSPKDLIFL